MQNRPSLLKYLPVFFIGVLAVSTASIFIRFAQQEAPSLVIAAARLTIATLILAPFVFKRASSELKGLPLRGWLLILLAGVLLALHFASWISSLEYTSVASSVVLADTAPLWVALLSPIFLHEKLSKKAMAGLIISIIGSILIGVSRTCLGQGTCASFSDFVSGRSFWGNLLALAGALTYAFYLMTGKKIRAGLSFFTFLFIVYGIAAVTLLTITFISGESFAGYSSKTWLWIALMALIPQLIGHSTFNYLLKYLPAAYVSMGALIEPVGAVLLAWMFLSELPIPLEIIGGGLVIAGLAFITLTSGRSEITEE